MKKISILGTGVMGNAIGQAYLKAGYNTTVWNRTLQKAEALVSSGANLAKTEKELILEGDLIISAVATYDNLIEILDPIEIDWKTKILINISSGTTQQARDFGEFAQKRNIPYLDAAAMSGVKRVGHKEGLFLFSGDYSYFEKAKPLLEVLGSPAYLGSDFGLTPLYDNALFTLAWGSLIGFYHASALIAAEGQQAGRFAALAANHTPFLNALFKEHAEAIGTGIYPNDDGNIEIHKSAMEHVKALSEEKNIGTDFPSFIIDILSRTEKMGLGDSGIASVIEAIKKDHAK
ncbi:NAD(P)-dependent oxidoreductase [Chitinophaga sp. SYP-B3965]|uniref:NAD(P)-dependent oxidoreductase n=1 Tax=Chitinophaga sp. SYP-B3965 TaxID=2663120 RepID=UPI001299BFDF|nr:NAD(P)-binding domain-containing protein [Chitinophaga sp. SYP-B3965]MRG48299.1 NAD(P)-dependent oxidoreductase [Chitinophaga sp. SYP-B3965]